MKIANFFALFSLLSVQFQPLLANAATAYDPSTDLNAVFGASCPSFSGSINTLADSQGSALSSVIQNVRNDTSCNAVNGVLNQIQSTDFSQLNSDKASITALKATLQDDQAALAAEIAKPVDPDYAKNGYASPGYQDPTYIQTLKGDMQEVGQELYTAQNSVATDNSTAKFKTIQQYQALSGNLFNALSANQTCASHFPGLGAQVAGQILTTSATLASGFMAPVLLATGEVFNNFMSYLANYSSGKDFKKINDARIVNASQCALESLSATYCQARDLKLVATAPAPVCTENFEGGRIISQEIDSLNTWLSRISAGSSATSPGVATDKKAGKSLQLAADGLKIDLDAAVSKSQQKVSAGATSAADESIDLLNKLAALMAQQAYSGSSPGVLSTLFEKDSSCGPYAYLQTGGVQAQCPGRGESETCLQCVQREFPSQISIASLAAAKNTAMDAANKFVEGEVGLVEESNPLDVLSQYTKKQQNFKTPENFVVDTQAYLASLQKDPDFKSKVDQDTINDLKTRLDSTECSLDPGPSCPAPPAPVPPVAGAAAPAVVGAQQSAQDTLNSIHDQLIPDEDLFFVSNTLSDLVKKDLDRRISGGNIDDNLANVLKLSNSDTLGAVVQATIGRDAAIAQSQNAQSQTKTNLDAIANMFGSQLASSIQTQTDPALLAQACVRAALTPNAPKLGGTDITAKCKGTVWKSVHPGNDISFDNMMKKPFEDRTCTVYDFYRKSKLMDSGAKASK